MSASPIARSRRQLRFCTVCFAFASWWFAALMPFAEGTAPIPRVAPLPVHYHGVKEQVQDGEQQDQDGTSPAERRSLAPAAPTCPELHAGSTWGPLRIGYEIVSLGAQTQQNTAFMDRLHDPLLKNSFAFWSRALQSRRYSQTTSIDRDSAFQACGFDANSQTTENSNGRKFMIDNVDLYLFIDIDDPNLCSGATLAAASSCYIDQCGRPVAGAVTLCTNSGFSDLRIQDNLFFNYANVVHEIGHVLFFFELLWPNMVNDDGTPMWGTNRGYYAFDCYGRWNLPYNTGRRWYPALHDPDTGMIGITEHGLFTLGQCTCPYGSFADHQAYDGNKFRDCLNEHPHCQYEIRTPKVVQKAREYFNCPTLTGMPLENTPTSRCSAYGNHWEQRVLNSEMFVPTGGPDDNTFVSPMSLAFAEDTGWFKADYSRATISIENFHWGYQKGCPFVTDACISPASQQAVNLDFFCARAQDTGCAPHRDGRQLGFCDLDESLSTGALPAEYQYWADDADKGGVFGMLDHCPKRFAYAQKTGDCKTTRAYLSGVMFNAGSANSQCFHSLATLTGNTLSMFSTTGSMQFLPTCYRVACAGDHYDVYGRLEDGNREEVRIARCDSGGNFVANSNELASNLASTQIVQCNSFTEMCGRIRSPHLFAGLQENELANPTAAGIPAAAPFYGRSTETCLGRRTSAAECPTYCGHFFQDYCATNSGMCVSDVCKSCMDAHSCTSSGCRQMKCGSVCPTCSSVADTNTECNTVYAWGYTPAYCPAQCDTYYARFCSTNAGPGMCVDAACYQCDTACVDAYRANNYFDIATCWASCETCPSPNFCTEAPVTTTPHFDPSYDVTATSTAKPPAQECLTCATSHSPSSTAVSSTTSSTTAPPGSTNDASNIPAECQSRYALDAVPYPSCPAACAAHYADFCQPFAGPGMCVAETCKVCDQACAVNAINNGWSNQQYQDCYSNCSTCPKWVDWCSTAALQGATIVTKEDIAALISDSRLNNGTNSRITSVVSTNTSTTTAVGGGVGGTNWNGCRDSNYEVQCPSVSGSLALSMATPVNTTMSQLTELLGPSIRTALAKSLAVEVAQVRVLSVRAVTTSGMASARSRSGVEAGGVHLHNLHFVDGEDESEDEAAALHAHLVASSVFPGQKQLLDYAEDHDQHNHFGQEPHGTEVNDGQHYRGPDGQNDHDHHHRKLQQHQQSKGPKRVLLYKGPEPENVLSKTSNAVVGKTKQKNKRDNSASAGGRGSVARHYPGLDHLDVRKSRKRRKVDKVLAQTAQPPPRNKARALDEAEAVRRTRTTRSRKLSAKFSTQHGDGRTSTRREIFVQRPAARAVEVAAAAAPAAGTDVRARQPSSSTARTRTARSTGSRRSSRSLSSSSASLEANYEVQVATQSEATTLLTTLQASIPPNIQQNIDTQLVADLGPDYSVGSVAEGSMTPAAYIPPTAAGASGGAASGESGSGSPGSTTTVVSSDGTGTYYPGPGNGPGTTITLSLYPSEETSSATGGFRSGTRLLQMRVLTQLSCSIFFTAIVLRLGGLGFGRR
mmetsp:Transcript_26238/g.66086  ORF Transcript_26238/g.66086 Transcript_26238/m.66086 type:complete len:1541 (+) Transcript_26238:674-5296(+)